MSEKPVTNNAYKVLTCLYGEYLERTNHGVLLENAKVFSEPESLVTCFHPSDTRSLLHELTSAGFLTSDVLGNYKLTKEAIIFMESKLLRGLSDVADILNGVINIATFFRPQA